MGRWGALVLYTWDDSFYLRRNDIHGAVLWCDMLWSHDQFSVCYRPSVGKILTGDIVIKDVTHDS